MGKHVDTTRRVDRNPYHRPEFWNGEHRKPGPSIGPSGYRNDNGNTYTEELDCDLGF